MSDPMDKKSDERESEGTIKKLSLKREALKKLKVRTGVATGEPAISGSAPVRIGKGWD